MNIISAIKRAMRRITPAELAATELADAELSRLEHQTAVDFSDAMVGYNNKRIERLRAYLAPKESA